MAMRIAYAVASQIADHAEADAPIEACGLLAGESNSIKRAIPLRNNAATPSKHFRLAPEEQLKTMKAIDEAGLDWIGIYHSHPRSAPIPSQTDIAAALDAKLLHLIISLEHARPKLKLWRIDGNAVSPIELIFETGATDDEGSQFSTRQRVAIAVVGIASFLLLVAISLLLLPPAPELAPVP